MGSIMTHWYDANDLLAKIIEQGLPYKPETKEAAAAGECIKLRWVRGDEDGNLIPTAAGLSRYEKIRILRLKDR